MNSLINYHRYGSQRALSTPSQDNYISSSWNVFPHSPFAFNQDRQINEDYLPSPAPSDPSHDYRLHNSLLTLDSPLNIPFAQREPSTGPSRSTRHQANQRLLLRCASRPLGSSRDDQGHNTVRPINSPVQTQRHLTTHYIPIYQSHHPLPQEGIRVDARPQTPNVSSIDRRSRLHGANHLQLPMHHPVTPTSLTSPFTTPGNHSRSASGSAYPVDDRVGSPSASTASGSGSSGSALNPCIYSPMPVRPGLEERRKLKKSKLTDHDRKMICQYHLNNPNEKQEIIAHEFKVERSTVSKILKNKDKWLKTEEGADKLPKLRPSKFPEIEKKMIEHLKQWRENKMNIADNLIRNTALKIAKELNISESTFKASSGWIENVKHRFGIKAGVWKGTETAVHSQRGLLPPLSSSASDIPLEEHSPSIQLFQHREDGNTQGQQILGLGPALRETSNGHLMSDTIHLPWPGSTIDGSTLKNSPVHSPLSHDSPDSNIAPEQIPPSMTSFHPPLGYSMYQHQNVLPPVAIHDIPQQLSAADAVNAMSRILAFLGSRNIPGISDDNIRVLRSVEDALLVAAGGVLHEG